MEVLSVRGCYRGTVAKVQTEIGTLEVTFTNGQHAHVSTISGESVTVRGTEYSVSVHLYAPEWKAKNEDYVSVMRKNWGSVSKMYAAPTIKQKVVDVCAAAIRAVVEFDPAATQRAEIADVQEKYNAACGKVVKLETELTEAQAEAARLAGKLAEIGGEG